MFTHQCQKRITYGETDRMGYLYYGHYATLYEIGRVEALRSLGISYKNLEDELKVMMPVLLVESRYIKAVKYDELITITTILDELPKKMACFHSHISNENGELVHKGVTKLFYVDMITNQRVSAPQIIIENLTQYFGE